MFFVSMGMYNDQTGRSVRTACGANRYNPSLGSTVFSACIACAEGNSAAIPCRPSMTAGHAIKAHTLKMASASRAT